MGSFFSAPAIFLSILTRLLHSSTSLSYLILAVPMPECVGNVRALVVPPFSIAILNGMLVFFCEAKRSLLGPKLRLSKSN